MKKAEMSQQETPTDTIGVIYCPRPGGHRRWKKILRLLKNSGIRFDYIQSENSSDVERIATIMVRNGYTTIIIVGGDSALNYAINAIMQTEFSYDKRPILGVIPAGYGNDFARYWNFEPKDYHLTIKRLKSKHTRRIDVGCITIQTENKDTHTTYFLNCVNIGTAASIIGLRHTTFNILGSRPLSHFISAFMLLFKKMSYKLSFRIAGEKFEQRATTLCVGSAHGYGQTPRAVPYNGMVDICLAPTTQFFQLIHGLWLLISGRFLNHKGISVWRTREIQIDKTDNAPVSIDGRLAYNKVRKIKINVIPEAIDFLI